MIGQVFSKENENWFGKVVSIHENKVSIMIYHEDGTIDAQDWNLEDYTHKIDSKELVIVGKQSTHEGKN